MRNEKIVTDMGQADLISLLAEARFFCRIGVLQDWRPTDAYQSVPAAGAGGRCAAGEGAPCGFTEHVPPLIPAAVPALAAALALLSKIENVLQHLALARNVGKASSSGPRP